MMRFYVTRESETKKSFLCKSESKKKDLCIGKAPLHNTAPTARDQIEMHLWWV